MSRICNRPLLLTVVATAALSSLTASVAHAQMPARGEAAGSRLSLAELEQLALERHPILRRDSARIDAAEGVALQAGLYPNPRFDTNNPEVFAGRNSNFNVGFMQEIVVKGKLRLQRAASQRDVQQAEYSLMSDRYGLLTAVRRQFYATLAAQRRVQVLKRLQTITATAVKTGQEALDARQIARTQYLLLKIDAERIQGDALNAERVLAGERAQLAAIVGLPQVAAADLAGKLTELPPRFDEQVLQQFVTTEHPMVQIARLEIDKNKILLQRAEAEKTPNITVGPSYSWGMIGGQDQFWLTVTFPIPISDRNQGNIRSARANIHHSVENLEAVQLALLQQLADVYNRHRGAVEQAAKYREEILPPSLEVLNNTRAGFQAGEFDFSTYLQAQRTVMESNMAYIAVLETVWSTAAELSGLLQLEQM